MIFEVTFLSLVGIILYLFYKMEKMKEDIKNYKSCPCEIARKEENGKYYLGRTKWDSTVWSEIPKEYYDAIIMYELKECNKPQTEKSRRLKEEEEWRNRTPHTKKR